MASRRRGGSANKPRSLVGSARRINLRAGAAAVKAEIGLRDRWQEELWAYFDTCPEFKQIVLYTGSVASRIKAYPAAIPANDYDGEPIALSEPESDVSPDLAAAAQEEMAALRSELGGQAEIFRLTNMNWEVAAECFLVGLGPRDQKINPINGQVTVEATQQSWAIHSISEVSVNSGGQTVIKIDGRGNGFKLDPDEGDSCIRLWTRHARWTGRADCAMHACLTELRILQALSNERLALSQANQTRGPFRVPTGLTLAAPPPDSPEDDATEDPLLNALSAAFTEPVEDPDSPYVLDYVYIRGDREDLKSDVFGPIDTGRKRDAELTKDVEEAVARVARGANLPPEKVLGHMQCVDSETEVLTARGWLRFDQVEAGDEALTLNHESGLSEWQNVRAVATYPATNHPMVSLEGQSHSSLTTLDHNWPIITQRGKRKWRHSKDFNTAVRVIPAAPSGDRPTEAKWSDAFVELVAWTWTEGTFHNLGKAVIYQSLTANPEHCASIRRSLTEMFGPPDPTLYAASRGRGRMAWRERQVGTMAHFTLNKHAAALFRDVMDDQKIVAPAFIRSLTAAQLELFIQRSVDGDGWHSPQGQVQLHQSVEARTDAFELALILTGRAVTRRVTTSTGGFKDSDRYQVISRNPASMRVGFGIQKSEETYTGTVWCPNVENGTWLARRRGSVYFTGNTTFANAREIDRDEFDDYHDPRVRAMLDAFTVGYLRPNLLARESSEGVAAFDPSEVARVVLTFDPEDIIGMPPTEASATEGMGLGTISEAAWRSAKGFTEDDAPDPLELITRAGINARRIPPEIILAMIEPLAKAAGVELPTLAESLIPPTAPLVPPTGTPPPGTPVPTPSEAAFQDRLFLTALQIQQSLRAQGIDPSDEAAVLAAAARRHPRPAANNVGPRLAAIDRTLFDRTHVAASAAMDRALERAGNKIRSKLTASNRALVAHVRSALIASHLGPAIVADAAGDDADLFDGEFDSFATDYRGWVGTAQQKAAAIAAGLVTVDRDRLDETQAQNADGSRDWLIAALSGVAMARLYRPEADAQPGEGNPSLTAPASIVRTALARAGGSTTDAGNGPVGLVATGTDILGVLADGGATVGKYTWQYGGADHPFQPHEDLDGVEFDNYDDPALANDQGWPPFPMYFEGDHQGCSCLTVLTVDGPSTDLALPDGEG